MDWKGVPVIVLGGAGFIASHIVDRLLELGADVSVYDNLSFGSSNIEGLNINLYKNDILDFDSLIKAVEGKEVVFHNVARLEILHMESPQYDLQVNTLGTLNVLETCRKMDVEKIVYSSSSGVYGNPMYLPLDERHPTDPFWHYGVSKLAAEKYVSVYEELYGLKTVSLRYGIVYGPREWYGRALTRFIRRVLSGVPPIIFNGAEGQTRDYVSVKDVVDANILSIEKDVTGIFNIGSGVATTIRQLAEIVVQQSGKNLKSITRKVEAGKMGRKSKELRYMVLDISKAINILGWKPKIPLREGIREEIAWANENMNEYWSVDRV